MLRSIFFYRQLNIAVVLGVAVAGATLTGALMVGDSVKHSLRELTFERLGGIEYVALPQYLLGPELAGSLQDSLDGVTVSQAMLLRGGARTEDLRASKVSISGIDPAFFRFFPAAEREQALQKGPGQIFPSALVNRRLADELKLAIGDEMVVSFPKDSAIHRDSLYGKKNTEDVVEQMRVTVKEILADEGMGRFSLAPHQDVPFNVFVALDQLQRAMGRRDGANTLLLGGAGAGRLGAEAMGRQFAQQLKPADLNIKIRRGENYLGLETPGFFFSDKAAAAVMETARAQGLEVMPVSTYLVNRMELGEGLVPYSLMTALDGSSPLAETELEGRLPTGLGEIAINRWTADDLGANIGDTLTVQYFVVGAHEKLEEARKNLEVTGILAMTGLGADRGLTPIFPGAEDADDMNDWDPTFPMDMKLIRAEDEAYWDDHNTSPKAFVAPELAREMWAGRFGFFTGFRMVPKDGTVDLARAEAALSKALVAGIDPALVGLGLVAVKAQGMEASKGATDFTGLFIGLSFFIIGSACLLIALFFRLLVQGRLNEVGMLAAMGYSRARVRRRLLGEGLLLASFGALVGAFGGMAYAGGVMAGLRHFWNIGTQQLYFHFNPTSLVLGFVMSVLAALLSIYFSLRVLRGFSLVALVSGSAALERPGQGTRAARVFKVSLVLSLLTGLATAWKPDNLGLGFAGGACLFLCGIAGLATWLGRRGGNQGMGGTLFLASRNTARQAGRSLVCVSLVAMAVYTIVAVGLYRNTGEVDSDDHASGAGGFFLSGEAEPSLHVPLEDSGRREDLNLSEGVLAQLAETHTVSMRLRPGDDTSCLNLFAPREPRFLGLRDPEQMAGRFTFQAQLGEDGQDPWSLLNQPLDDGAIPVIGDFNSVMWIMKSGLGKTYTVTNGFGEAVPLRFVALLKGSVFQSELILSEQHFQTLFPDISGYGFFLFDAANPGREGLSALERDLAGYGMDLTTTAAKIKAFHAIENTYISIFQMLGGLGLLLGTVGLGAIIFRNALERKGELAAMRAFGFRRRKLSTMLMLENAFLVVWGILVGGVAAVVSMLPHLLSTKVETSWTLMFGTLAGVFVVGMISTWWAVLKAGRFPLLAALRGS